MKRLPKMFQFAVAVFSAATIAGCVGDFDPIQDQQTDGGGGGIAQQLFLDNVSAQVVASCGDGNGACHGNVSPVIGVADNYAAVIGAKASLFPVYDQINSSIILYGQPGNHENRAPPYPDITPIQEWLAEEEKEANQ